MASTDDVFTLLKAVNETTLKRMEQKTDAMNAVTLKRMEDQLKQMDDYLHLLGHAINLISDKVGVPPSTTPGITPTTPTTTTPTTSTTDPHLGGPSSM